MGENSKIMLGRKKKKNRKKEVKQVEEVQADIIYMEENEESFSSIKTKKYGLPSEQRSCDGRPKNYKYYWQYHRSQRHHNRQH